MMIDQSDVDRVASAAISIPAARGSYIEEDFVLNLQGTVLDYMMSTTAVIRALEHFNKHRSSEIGNGDDLEHVFDRFPDDKEGNLALAQHLRG